MRRLSRASLCAFLFLLLSQAPSAAEDQGRHGIAPLGALRYPQGFQNFDYVNPRAPKGGTLRLAALGGFDNFNPLTIKGRAAAYLGLIYESLTKSSLDEVLGAYGLLAERILVAPDNRSVSFFLRAEARFHDGTPLTAEDVVWSFQTLREQNPFYRAYYHDVARAAAITPRHVRFDFAHGRNKELPLILGQFPVLSKKHGAARDMSETSLEALPGSGPYRIAKWEAGRFIEYARNENYWGESLAVNRGEDNFDRIRVSYFGDDTVALEAFKAGRVDFRLETSSKNWATAYQSLAARNSDLVLEEIPNALPSGMQAFVFNLRRDLFRDARVRQAFNLAFDFEWMNKNLFYGQYERTASYFDRSELAAKGLPRGLEKDLLERFRDDLPEALFREPYQNPQTRGTGRQRAELRQAGKLLREAGWRVEKGVLTHESGLEMRPQFLLVQPSFERVVLAYLRSLKRLGIMASVRIVDSAQYRNRLQTYDFDIIVGSFGQSLSPGNEQRDFWGSESADIPGGRNLAGIKNPVIDRLIESLIKAPDRKRLIAATRALDRVLLWNHYVVPQWHGKTHRLAWWKPLAHPAALPRYAVGFPSLWWMEESVAAR